MKNIAPKLAAVVIIVIVVISLLINGIRFHHPFQPAMRQQPPQRMEGGTAVGGRKNYPPEDLYAGFSAEARRVIAADIARQDEARFGRMFTVQCVSASQSPRKFNGYGVSVDLVVVTARFRLSAANGIASGAKWSKDYAVSETIESGQFQGLTSSDTIQRVVGTLKEQLQKDNDFLSVLHNTSKL